MDQKSVNATNRSLISVNTGRGVVVITVTGKPKITANPHSDGISNQGVATLIVMCLVLAIIIMFCCFAAPGIRDLCKKYVFRTCVIDDPEVNNAYSKENEGFQRAAALLFKAKCLLNNPYYIMKSKYSTNPLTVLIQTPEQSSTPTLILLPFGRMLVVDRSMFQALQSDPGGLDFLELSRQVIRNQSFFTESTPSALDCDSTNKGLTPDSIDVSPPAYEDIFKKDLPPAYSELSLMFRTQRRFSECASAQSIELGRMQEGHLGNNDTEVPEM